MENEYCSYMHQRCSGNCEYAYENRHGSDGYCCVRPDTKVERIIGDLRVSIVKIKGELSTVEMLLNNLMERK